jgi:hypothetical protein
VEVQGSTLFRSFRIKNLVRIVRGGGHERRRRRRLVLLVGPGLGDRVLELI